MNVCARKGFQNSHFHQDSIVFEAWLPFERHDQFSLKANRYSSPANVTPMPKNGMYRDTVNINRTRDHFRFQTHFDFPTVIDGFCDQHAAHTSSSRVIQ